MLEIRQELLHSFENAHRRMWEDQVIAHLERTCPESIIGMSEEDLRSRVQQCEIKANGYNIFAANQVASFTQILFEEGFDFDVRPPDPWIIEILSDPQRDQFAKVDHLWAYLDGYEKEDIEDVAIVDEELNTQAKNAPEDDLSDDLETETMDFDDELDDFEIDGR